MSEPKGSRSSSWRWVFWLIVFAVSVYVIAEKIDVLGNILLLMLGFGGVILFHEFGHFVLAKLAGIKVEAFSIGFPPTLAGILRTEEGYRIRVLPKFFPKADDESGEGRLSFTIGAKGKGGETEWRIGLIPFGGFVKMLGQEDVGPAKASDDPRSYANKPVSARMAVIAAGVIFNAVGAMLILMGVFLVGINMPPAVVGGVLADSPAEHAGLKAGDEIVAIDGKRGDLEYFNIAVAAALSEKGEPVKLRVRHEDGSEEDVSIVSESREGSATRLFGIEMARSLTVAKVHEAERLFEKTGLRPGDKITSVNGKEVRAYWEFEEEVVNANAAVVTVSAERISGDPQEVESVETRLDIVIQALSRSGIESEPSLRHICSMVPRLQVDAVGGKKPSAAGGLVSLVRGLLGKIGIKTGGTQDVSEAEPVLESGDIVLSVGGVENPTYKEFRKVVAEHKDKELAIRVLRADASGEEKPCTVSVKPRFWPDVNEVLIGISFLPALDAGHPVVATTIEVEGGGGRLEIPRGATITAIDGTAVSSFYDVIRLMRGRVGQAVAIEYRVDKGTVGEVSLEQGWDEGFITVVPTTKERIPFRRLERLYKADGPVDAIVTGCKKTGMFMVQTYLTLKGLISRAIGPRGLMGPVGILATSYMTIAEQPLIYYVYLLGMISAMLVVLNFMPLLPLDGGHFLFLLVEKIKGSAVSERIQGTVAYAGWLLIMGLVVYLTYNDITRFVRDFLG